ncbi:MAG: dTDP-4-dehydrorhamnose 3,5-epimerase [Chitinophagales bacterium]|nr:dTDP-4-dehydrorhamnose 3,5-epimerase [Chitinophagales bacterium]MCZ2393207.1 dTDP-4-dehydrorhamnose 3,5-epimerase [Chitinophagales bacterium]
MHIITTPLEGLLILKPRVFYDSRGYFFESFNLDTFKNNGLNYEFVQDNQSFSQYGVLRGLHFQKDFHAQSKLVRVLSGKILDVVVDIRKDSSTYLQHFSIELSSENFLQLLVPRGFAHGFVVLSQSAQVLYKCDNFYNPSAEDGLMYDDPQLGIDWILDKSDLLVNQKDLEYKYL